MFSLLCVFVFASAGRTATVERVMCGHPHDVPVNSTRVLAAARFAVAEFNRAHVEDELAYKIVSITSAKIQVVAGLNYILEVQLGRTKCRKSDTADGGPCDFHSEYKFTMMGGRNNRRDRGMKEDVRQRSQVGLQTKTSQLTWYGPFAK